MKIARSLFVPVWLVASVAYAENPLSKLKTFNEDGVGPSVLATFDACQVLAPAPFGGFVPPDLPLPPIPVIPGSVFLPPAPRVCPVAVSGRSDGSPGRPPGQSYWDLDLSVDYSTYRSNGSGGGCAQASGSLIFTKASQGNAERLTLNHAGLVCDTVSIGSPKTYTATYHITGGTRKFEDASGTGDLAVSVSANETLLHLDGNVLAQ